MAFEQHSIGVTGEHRNLIKTGETTIFLYTPTVNQNLRLVQAFGD